MNKPYWTHKTVRASRDGGTTIETLHLTDEVKESLTVKLGPLHEDELPTIKTIVEPHPRRARRNCFEAAVLTLAILIVMMGAATGFVAIADQIWSVHFLHCAGENAHTPTCLVMDTVIQNDSIMSRGTIAANTRFNGTVTLGPSYMIEDWEETDSHLQIGADKYAGITIRSRTGEVLWQWTRPIVAPANAPHIGGAL